MDDKGEGSGGNWFFNLLSCGKSQGLYRQGALRRPQAVPSNVVADDRHPKVLFATKVDEAAEDVEKILDKLQLEERNVMQDEGGPSQEIQNILFDDNEAQQPRQGYRDRRSLTVPRGYQYVRNENLASRRLSRSASTPRFFFNADFPYKRMRETDGRRHFQPKLILHRTGAFRERMANERQHGRHESLPSRRMQRSASTPREFRDAELPLINNLQLEAKKSLRREFHKKNEELTSSRMERSASTPRTFPHAELPIINSLQLEDRRKFRLGLYELQLKWKSQREQKKREARLQYLRETTRLVRTRARLTAPRADPEPKCCCPINCKWF